jgi:hypothetical protein
MRSAGSSFTRRSLPRAGAWVHPEGRGGGTACGVGLAGSGGGGPVSYPLAAWVQREVEVGDRSATQAARLVASVLAVVIPQQRRVPDGSVLLGDALGPSATALKQDYLR